MSENKKVILESKGLVKHFGGIFAVDDIDFKLYEGEILGIVGDNGAGKSTLIKCITGAYTRDQGDIILRGSKIQAKNTLQTRNLGIETVYQNQGLIDELNASYNLFLGREKIKSGLIGKIFQTLDRKFMNKETKELLKSIGIELKKPNAPVKELSGGQQQAVVVGRSAYWRGEVIILDEPTSGLGVEEQNKVLQMVRDINTKYNISFIVISHNLEHVFDLVDRILVMRCGKIVGNKKIKETTRNEIVALITGAAK